MSLLDKSGFDMLTNVLFDMNNTGNFSLSILTDKDGLPIVSASIDGSVPEKQAAVIGFIRKSSVQVSKLLGWEELEEITYSFSNGFILVSRPFFVKENQLTLASIVKNKDGQYREIMTMAITEIQKAWEFYWK
jgi:predicted regulator of Ras-like GTPase activity (Roadblock/LC7/MglB family)